MAGRRFRWLAWAAAASAYLQVALGGVVRVSGSGLGCENDWPLCQGRLLPPLEPHAILEYAHRTVGTLTGLLIIATVVIAWTRYRRLGSVTWLATGSLAAVVVEGLVGAVVVFRDLAGWLVLVHMALAMVIIGGLAGAAVFALPPAAGAARPGLRRLLALAAALTFLMVLTGSAVVATGADRGCHSWPLCAGGLGLDFGGVNAFTMLHRLTVGVAALVVAYALVRALGGAAPAPLRLAAALSLGLLAAQALLVGVGAALTEDDALWNGLHVAVASAVWMGVVVAALLSLPRAAAGSS